MKSRNLNKIIRRQTLPKLVHPLALVIVSIVLLIIKPYKNAMDTIPITNLDNISSEYEKGNEYIEYTANKLYYTGLDYKIGKKITANIYYTISNGTCYYFILTSNSSNGLATTLDNVSIKARLVEDDSIYKSINEYLANNVNFSKKGMTSLSNPLLISQYDYSRDFSRFIIITLKIILIICGLLCINEIISMSNPLLSFPALRLKKYGNRRTLYALAKSELPSAQMIGHKNVFMSDTFLFIIGKHDVDIIPLENIVWVYDYKEVKHNKKKFKHSHPLCVVTDAKKVIKISHVSDKGINSITNALVEKYPGIMVGYEN